MRYLEHRHRDWRAYTSGDAMSYEEVEFRAIDGTTLKGRLFEANQPGPAVVMCTGFNSVMDMLFLPETAGDLQASNITALLFDPRNTGASSGAPRNEIDPMKQIEDMSDALTFLSCQRTADSTRLGFWGFSLGGTVALCAASLDKRAKFVVAVNPLTDLEFEHGKQEKVLATAIKDRESQSRGNSPFALQMVNEHGENPVGFGHGADKEKYSKIVQAGQPLGKNHVNEVTLQSYYKMVMWQPFSLWRWIGPTKVLWITGAMDRMSYFEAQKEYFEGLQTEKQHHVEEGAGHEDILADRRRTKAVERMVGFIVMSTQRGD
ncbi:Alpha/Beta hydrolase protein [Lophiotrema nucula]|uniref:Alpha/Beta hydrolase protein n=1 Tax=Lophiotrema nucula TaxID=690887 RepID=A0A6A5YVX1_9PLEO|nr:Alpha/Beta hydrolase protein [Lophiotrema nucula]